MQFLGLNSKHFGIGASYSMCECVKTKNAYYNGVWNGAVWWILVMDLADLLGIAGMKHQEVESSKRGKTGILEYVDAWI